MICDFLDVTYSWCVLLCWLSFSIAVYMDDLCIAAESPSAISDIFKTKYNLKVKGDGKLSYHLGADYFEDPDGTFVSQPKKYLIS